MLFFITVHISDFKTMLFFITVQINDFRMLLGCLKEACASCTAWAAV